MICYYKAERLSILVSAYMKGFLHVSQLYTDCTSFVAIEKLMWTCLYGYTHSRLPSSVASDEWSIKDDRKCSPTKAFFVCFDLINVF